MNLHGIGAARAVEARWRALRPSYIETGAPRSGRRPVPSRRRKFWREASELDHKCVQHALQRSGS